MSTEYPGLERLRAYVAMEQTASSRAATWRADLRRMFAVVEKATTYFEAKQEHGAIIGPIMRHEAEEALEESLADFLNGEPSATPDIHISRTSRTPDTQVAARVMSTESQAYRLRRLNEMAKGGDRLRRLNEMAKGGDGYDNVAAWNLRQDWVKRNIDAIADCISALEGIVNVGDTMPFFATKALCEEALAALSPVPEVAE